MIMTNRYIKKLEEYFRLPFPQELKDELFSQLGEEPEPYAYSEQDIWEQSRKIVIMYGRIHFENFKF
jgi:hypothetical protein